MGAGGLNVGGYAVTGGYTAQVNASVGPNGPVIPPVTSSPAFTVGWEGPSLNAAQAAQDSQAGQPIVPPDILSQAASLDPTNPISVFNKGL